MYRNFSRAALVSAAPSGAGGNDVSGAGRQCLSADGKFAVLTSIASNLTTETQGSAYQVYLADIEAGTCTLVSADPGGNEGNGDSHSASISANGRFVAYASAADNLTPDNSNGTEDVFLFDRESGITTLVSVSSDGAEGDGLSGAPSVSDAGLIAFHSSATNLVAEDTNGSWDVFLHDVKTGGTRRVSEPAEGGEASGDSLFPAISGDGEVVVFTSFSDGLTPDDTNGVSDVYAYDAVAGGLRLLSANRDGTPGNGSSGAPVGAALSADGTWCAFASRATNLVRRDRNGDTRDVFLVRVR